MVQLFFSFSSENETHSVMLVSVTPRTLQSMELFGSEYGRVRIPFPSPGGLPNPGIKPRSLILQVDSLPAEPQGKPKNTGVGSLSFLQGIFLTQELNQGLLHCRWILYQLSSQGSPLATLISWQCKIVPKSDPGFKFLICL